MGSMKKMLIVFAGQPRCEEVYRDWFYERVVYPNVNEWTFDIAIHTQLNDINDNTHIKRGFTYPDGMVETFYKWYDNEYTRLKEVTVAKKHRMFMQDGKRYLQGIKRATEDKTYDQILACRFETLFTPKFTIGKPKVFTNFHAIFPDDASDLDYAFMGDQFSIISYFEGKSSKPKGDIKKHLTSGWDYRLANAKSESYMANNANLKTQSPKYQYLIDHGYTIDCQENLLSRHLGPGWLSLKTMSDFQEWPINWRKHVPTKFIPREELGW